MHVHSPLRKVKLSDFIADGPDMHKALTKLSGHIAAATSKLRDLSILNLSKSSTFNWLFKDMNGPPLVSHTSTMILAFRLCILSSPEMFRQNQMSLHAKFPYLKLIVAATAPKICNKFHAAALWKTFGTQFIPWSHRYHLLELWKIRKRSLALLASPRSSSGRVKEGLLL